MPETRKFIYDCDRDLTPAVNFDPNHFEWFGNRSYCLHPAGCGIQSNYINIEGRIPSNDCPKEFDKCNKFMVDSNYKAFGDCMARYRCSCA